MLDPSRKHNSLKLISSVLDVIRRYLMIFIEGYQDNNILSSLSMMRNIEAKSCPIKDFFDFRNRYINVIRIRRFKMIVSLIS